MVQRAHPANQSSGSNPSTPVTNSAEPVVLLSAQQATEHIESTIYALARQRGLVALLRCTMGAGKSWGVRDVAKSSTDSWLFMVPTYDLAEQHRALLGLPREEVSIVRPITQHRVDGRLTCTQLDVAQRLTASGLDPAEHLCGTCPHRQVHPATGAECPAHQDREVGANARIQIRVNTRAGDIMRMQRFAAQRAAAASGAEGSRATPLELDAPWAPSLGTTMDVRSEPKAGTVRSDALSRRTALPIVVLDEPPDPITVRPYDGDVDALRINVRALNMAACGALSPIVEAIARAYDAGFEGSLRDCLVCGGIDAAEVNSRILAVRRANLKLAAEAARALRSHVVDGGIGANRFADARLVLELITEAAHRPYMPFMVRHKNDTQLVARSAWVREAVAYVRAGGTVILLDATIDARDLAVLGIGAKGLTTFRLPESAAEPTPAPRATSVPLVVNDVHVRDAVGVERVFYKWASAPRSHHLRANKSVRWKEFQGVLRHLGKTVLKLGGPFGIVTDKPTCEALRAEWDRIVADRSATTPLPAEFARLAIDGVELRLGYFGNHRGLDSWKGVRVHAVIGDPFLPVTTVAAIAAYLGRPHHVVDRWRCQAEIQQAIGRGRPIREVTTLIHYGSREPHEVMAPQWANATKIASKMGRPRKEITVPGEGLAEERESLGLSLRAHAQKLALPYTTYRNRCIEEAAAGSDGATLPNGAAASSPRLLGTGAAEDQSVDHEVEAYRRDAAPHGSRDAAEANLLTQALRRAVDQLVEITGDAPETIDVVVDEDTARLVVTASGVTVSIEHPILQKIPFHLERNKLAELFAVLEGGGYVDLSVSDGGHVLVGPAGRLDVEGAPIAPIAPVELKVLEFDIRRRAVATQVSALRKGAPRGVSLRLALVAHPDLASVVVVRSATSLLGIGDDRNETCHPICGGDGEQALSREVDMTVFRRLVGDGSDSVRVQVVDVGTGELHLRREQQVRLGGSRSPTCTMTSSVPLTPATQDATTLPRQQREATTLDTLGDLPQE